MTAEGSVVVVQLSQEHDLVEPTSENQKVKRSFGRGVCAVLELATVVVACLFACFFVCCLACFFVCLLPRLFVRAGQKPGGRLFQAFLNSRSVGCFVVASS